MWFKKRIYADAAAATPLSPKAQRELVRLLQVYGNAGAIHHEGVEAKKELEKARKSIADSIGAHTDEIVFVASGTEGNNLAIQGVLRPLLQERGECHAITCAVEHQSVLEPLRALERDGLYVTELPVSADGLVSPKALAEALNDQTAFVSIQLVNSEMGAVEPIKEVSKVLRKQNKKIYFHTDAAQAPLWVDINVERLGVDLMTLDAQKVLGPKGIGALYIRRGTQIEPILWGGKQEYGLRGGTENVAAAGSFAVALADAKSGIEERVVKMTEVSDYLWSEIQRQLPDAVLNGPAVSKVKPCSRAANNLNVSVPGLEAEMAVVSLDALGIAASTRSACNIGSDEPSHVIKALGVPKEMAGTAIRLTLLPDATRRQASRIAQALKKTADLYRTR